MTIDEIFSNMPRLQWYVDDFGGPGDAGWVAEIDGLVAGVLWFRLFTSDMPGLGFLDVSTPELGIAVWPEFRRQGVGGTLLDAAKMHAAEMGFDRLCLTVSEHNERARGLYASRGFYKVSREGPMLKLVCDLEASRLTLSS